MKNFIRTFIFALPVLSSAALSCTDNLTDGRTGSSVCLTVNSVSAVPITRAAVRGTDFPAGEDVSIGIFIYSEGSGYTHRNVRCTRAAGQTQWTTDPEISLTGSPVTVYAYYPWTEGVNNDQTGITSSIDGNDWLWATPVTGVTSSAPSIDLSMKHSLSLVDLVFNLSSQYEDGTEMTALTVSSPGAGASGTFSFIDGTVSGNEAMTGEHSLSGTVSLQSENGIIRTSCLLIPYGTSQDERAAMDITCVIGGQTFRASLPQSNGIVIKTGVRSTITLSIIDNVMKVVSSEINAGDENQGTFTEEADDSSSDFIRGSLNCSNLKNLKHPRLFLTAEGFEDLKWKVSGERFTRKNLYKINRTVIDVADNCLSGAPIEYKLEGKRLLDQSREALKRLFACSYAFKITGLPVYRDKVREDLATVCAFSDWHPSHWLDVGEMALGVAIAYDWLYYSLSLEERTLIHRKLVDYCIRASIGNEFREKENNWNQVCYCGALAAALAVYEKDKTVSGQLIYDLLADNKAAMQAIYSPHGNYAEGYDYWGYGTGFQVMILQMLQTAFGTMFGLDEVAGFDASADYMLYMAGPCGKCFPYADGGTSNERPNFAMWWFAADRNDASLLFNEMRLFNAGTYPNCAQSRLLPLIPCVVKDLDIEGSISKPSGLVWSGEGVKPVVMVRHGWNFDENDAFVGLVGGYAKSSHGHMDAGSFVFDALGYRWSDDYTRPDYNQIETALGEVDGNYWDMDQSSLRWDVFKLNNLSHSTISVTNASSLGKVHASDHKVGSSSSKATITEVYTSSNAPGGKINMTSAVSDGLYSAFRSVKLLDGHTLEITDELSALIYRKAEIQWRMNTPANVTVSGNEIVLTQGGKSMSLTVVSDNSNVTPVLKNFGKTRPSDWDARTWDTGLNNNIVGFEATIPANKSVTFTTLITPKN